MLEDAVVTSWPTDPTTITTQASDKMVRYSTYLLCMHPHQQYYTPIPTPYTSFLNTHYFSSCLNHLPYFFPSLDMVMVMVNVTGARLASHPGGSERVVQHCPAHLGTATITTAAPTFITVTNSGDDRGEKKRTSMVTMVRASTIPINKQSNNHARKQSFN